MNEKKLKEQINKNEEAYEEIRRKYADFFKEKLDSAKENPKTKKDLEWVRGIRSNLPFDDYKNIFKELTPYDDIYVQLENHEGVLPFHRWIVRYGSFGIINDVKYYRKVDGSYTKDDWYRLELMTEKSIREKYENLFYEKNKEIKRKARLMHEGDDTTPDLTRSEIRERQKEFENALIDYEKFYETYVDPLYSYMNDLYARNPIDFKEHWNYNAIIQRAIVYTILEKRGLKVTKENKEKLKWEMFERTYRQMVNTKYINSWKHEKKDYFKLNETTTMLQLYVLSFAGCANPGYYEDFVDCDFDWL